VILTKPVNFEANRFPMPTKIKRIYEPLEKTDGYRILVDRLWPRGIKKENAHMDKWLKEVAPSTELRKWVHSDKGNWQQFIKRYNTELKSSTALQELLADLHRYKTITLLYAAKDEQQNHALVLKQFISEKSAK
jgi:uncharacterized protein YeaO (DUF488 family)